MIIRQKLDYHKWTTIKVQRTGQKEKVYDVNITSLEKVYCTVKDLIEETNNTLLVF